MAGCVGKLFAPRRTEALKFYQDKRPVIDWEVMVLFGMIVGAWLAAYTGGSIPGT